MSAVLTTQQHQVLDLAAARYAFPGRRVADIHATLGWTETRFWQAVNALLDDPAALAERPGDVRRLRRLREARRTARRG